MTEIIESNERMTAFMKGGWSVTVLDRDEKLHLYTELRVKRCHERVRPAASSDRISLR